MSTDKPLRFGGPKSETAWREFEAQGRLQPDEAGWWSVWGAGIPHVKAGDLILMQDRETGEQEAILIDGTFRAKAYPVRFGFNAEGENFTIGALVPIQLLRQGTRNMLRDEVSW